MSSLNEQTNALYLHKPEIDESRLRRQWLMKFLFKMSHTRGIHQPVAFKMWMRKLQEYQAGQNVYQELPLNDVRSFSHFLFPTYNCEPV